MTTVSCSEEWSGRSDSNARPPEPHSGALPGCATPRGGSVYRSRRTPTLPRIWHAAAPARGPSARRRQTSCAERRTDLTNADPEELKHRLTVFNAARAAVDRPLDLLRQHLYALPGAPAAEGTPLQDVVKEYLDLRAKENDAAEAFDALWRDAQAAEPGMR